MTEGLVRTAPVTVVIPHYCDSQGLRRCLQGISNQSTIPAQVVMVDDHSPRDEYAEAIEVVEEFKAVLNIDVASLPSNSGPGVARNIGIGLAKYELIAFVDSDDWWHPSKIDIQYHWMAEHPCATMSFHQVQHRVHKQAETLQISPRRTSLTHLLLRNSVPTSSVMIRWSGTEDGLFPARRHSEDYEAWLSLTREGEAWDLSAVLGFHDRGSGHAGLSSALWAMEIGELRALASLRAQRQVPALALWGALAWSLCRFVVRALRSTI